MQTALLLLLFTAVSFVQNMAFTWTSRSRNSGDPNYHRFASWASNGIWFFCQIFIVKIMWEPLMSGNYLIVAIGGLLYIVSTTEGSVFMMKLLLGHINVPYLTNLFVEKDKKKVGER